MYFITDKIRENICDEINSRVHIPYFGATIVGITRNDMVNELLLIDYYNLLMVKKAFGELEDYEKEIIKLINNDTVDELRLLLEDAQFFKHALSSTLTFEKLSRLHKQQSVDVAASQKEDNDLTTRALYKINILANTPSYEVKDLLEYYKDFILINGAGMSSHDMGSEIILGYFDDMKDNYSEKYRENIFAAIPAFYKCEKFLEIKDKRSLNLKSFLLIKKIELLSAEKLLNKTKTDNDFLSEIVKQYLYYEALPNEFKQSIDDYSEKIFSKRMKNKLASMSKHTNKKEN